MLFLVAREQVPMSFSDGCLKPGALLWRGAGPNAAQLRPNRVPVGAELAREVALEAAKSFAGKLRSHRDEGGAIFHFP